MAVIRPTKTAERTVPMFDMRARDNRNPAQLARRVSHRAFRDSREKITHLEGPVGKTLCGKTRGQWPRTRTVGHMCPECLRLSPTAEII